jgi:hypothetical protein
MPNGMRHALYEQDDIASSLKMMNWKIGKEGLQNA